jgi:penicillin-binding protein 1C
MAMTASTAAAVGLGLVTLVSLEPHQASTLQPTGAAEHPQVEARDGTPISTTYRNRWNYHDTVALHYVPVVLRQAFVQAEDRRVYSHWGVDWPARIQALWTNVSNGRVIRGASTITEQVVRILNPRPRTVWSRWLEGFEAMLLERRFSKDEILEFYLNQVPYAGRRRGIVQASRHYFSRSLSTLRAEESCVLAVLIRSPSRLDPFRRSPHYDRTDRRIAQARLIRGAQRLGTRLISVNVLDASTWKAANYRLSTTGLALERPHLRVHAPHFVREAHKTSRVGEHRVRTTLDPALQHWTQTLAQTQLDRLRTRDVGQASVLIADHQRGETLAWVNASRDKASDIDAVTTPRQPGSTLKPFVYALALERGWHDDSIITDAPLSSPLGTGSHEFRNYSRRYYGPVTVREALGNSLNIPAVKALQYIGTGPLIERLERMGVKSLNAPAQHYGEGLALGNGEVTLRELVTAYATLARGGLYAPLTLRADSRAIRTVRVFTPEASAMIGDILSDASARGLEFPPGSPLDMAYQTAAKTGTSSDYRDAWALGFNHRYTVGVWMGNLNRQAMREVTGSRGPALILSAIFSRLNRRTPPQPLSQIHTAHTAKPRPGNGKFDADNSGTPQTIAGAVAPVSPLSQTREDTADLLYPNPALKHPSPGLELALDPRVPRERQRLKFVRSDAPNQRTRWYVNDALLADESGASWNWPIEKGAHRAYAAVLYASGWVVTPTVAFRVH